MTDLNWGSGLWSFLHIMSFAKIDNPLKIQQFMVSLGHILPCPRCRRHYETYIRENGIPTKNNISKWLVDLHNVINKAQGKPTISFTMASKMWSQKGRDECGCESSKNNIPTSKYKILIIILLCIVSIYLIMKCNSKSILKNEQ